jgi:hypothetical protein
MLGLILGLSAAAPRGAGGEPAPSSCPPLTPERLIRMSRCELDDVYLHAGVGEVPWGLTRGRVIYKPGSRCSVALGRAASLAWQGKVLRPEDCTMINRVFGFRAIEAEVYYGESWMDGRPSVIFDYQGRSKFAASARDEVREVAPGLFLGAMYLRKCTGPEFSVYFVLEVEAGGRCRCHRTRCAGECP